MACGSSGHVLDDPGQARLLEQFPRGLYEVWILSVWVGATKDAVRLTRRTRMNGIKGLIPHLAVFHKPAQKVQCVTLAKRERVVRLRLDVHAHHLEARPVVPHGRAAGSAEEVEEAWLLAAIRCAAHVRSFPSTQIGVQ